jgi:hypothetical protein
VLFIEKEGFMPLLERVNLAERYDLGIMSTKGLSVTAARRLIDRICGENDIPCFVLHDFDKSGFSILGTLGRDTARYEYENAVEFIDLGLRLDDIEGLEPERSYDKGSRSSRSFNLRENGATQEEINFLVGDSQNSGMRVELNAMPSDRLVAFIERKLKENNVGKVLPDKDRLEQAYRLFDRGRRIEEAVEGIIAEIDEAEDEVEVPADIVNQVQKLLAKEPALRWDQALASIVGASRPRLSLDPEEEVEDPTLKFADGTEVEKIVRKVMLARDE